MIKEYFKIAIKNLKTRRLRSWLTIIGVVIGVFLIVSLLSLSEGIKTAVLQQLRMMGKDIIMVFPGEITNIVTAMTGNLELEEEDLKIIEKTEGVAFVLPMTWKAEVVRYEGKKKTVLLYGIPLKNGLSVLKNDMGWSLEKGRWPLAGKNEVIVGSLVPVDIFPEMRPGTEIFISGRKFKVAGILKSQGSKQDDSTIALDLEIFREITGERKGAKFVIVKASSEYPPEKVVESIKKELNENRKRRRGEDLSSFTVIGSEKITDIVGNIMAIIQAAIFALASVAIVVGGIGIMNTMYTSVHERIKEIGIMKAVGAKRRTITTIFLIESGFFGLVGGVGGTILGISLAKIVELYFQFHPLLYLKASASPWLILFSLAFSFIIGCVSGFLPARSASKLNPVDALRYE